MAPSILVRALPLLEIPRRLQQIMAKNKANLDKACIWDFLLWIKDVNKEVHEKKMTQFVNTYNMKTKLVKVGVTTMDFSTSTIGQVFNLPS